MWFLLYENLQETKNENAIKLYILNGKTFEIKQMYTSHENEIIYIIRFLKIYKPFWKKIQIIRFHCGKQCLLLVKKAKCEENNDLSDLLAINANLYWDKRYDN